MRSPGDTRARRPRSACDIIQNCEVRRILQEAGQVAGVETSRGPIRADRVGIAAAGHSSVLAKLAGFRLPVTSYALQAMVSEPIKPMLDTVVLSPGTGAYVSQSDKGEIVMGAMLDLFPSYAQRGSFAVKQAIIAATARAVSLVQPPAVDASVGGHRRCGARLEPHHRTDARSAGFTSIAAGEPAASRRFPVGGWTLAHVLATGQEPCAGRAVSAANDSSPGGLIDEAAASGHCALAWSSHRT